jgi:hypothetical protein
LARREQKEGVYAEDTEITEKRKTGSVNFGGWVGITAEDWDNYVG